MWVLMILIKIYYTKSQGKVNKYRDFFALDGTNFL